MYFEVRGLLEATRSVIDEARKIWQVETQILEGQGTDNPLSRKWLRAYGSGARRKWVQSQGGAAD